MIELKTETDEDGTLWFLLPVETTTEEVNADD
jgi:hypothetical protein